MARELQGRNVGNISFGALALLLQSAYPTAGAISFVASSLFALLPDAQEKQALDTLRKDLQKKLRHALEHYLSENVADDAEAAELWQATFAFIEAFPLHEKAWLECRSGEEAAEKVFALPDAEASLAQSVAQPERVAKVKELVRICYREVYKERDHLRGLEERLSPFFAENYALLAEKIDKLDDKLEHHLPYLIQRAQKVLKRTYTLARIHIPQRHYQPHHPPSELLRADLVGAVVFHGREQESADIAAWCQQDNPVALRCYAAQGGMGKTRLFIEMCKERQKEAWRAGFLSEEDLLKIEDDMWQYLFSGDRHLFLVLDYAERHLKEDFAKFLRKLDEVLIEHAPKHKIRVVLLTRDISADLAQSDWWRALKAEHKDISATLSIVEFDTLASVTAVAEQSQRIHLRQKYFGYAVETFAAILHKSYNPASIAQIDFSLDYMDRILYLQARALAFVEGVELKEEKDILEHILIREEGFINKQLSRYDFQLHHLVIAEILTVFADSDELNTRAQAIKRLKRLYPDWLAKDLAAIVDTLHIIYGGKQWIEPAMPDIIIEEWRRKLR